jgi:uncharacterized protein (DUF1778 family)
MSERKETFYITRNENHTRLRVAEEDYKIIKAYATHNQRTLTAELHYLVVEAAKCRLEHQEKFKILESQLDQVIALAQAYKKRYGPLA